MFSPGNGVVIPAPQLMDSFVPTFANTDMGRRIVSPDNPYVAAIAPNKAYFIDHCYSPEHAQYIKEHLEWLTPTRDDVHIFIDEIAATASVRVAGTNETLFEFNPAYARVMFAKGINQRNPALNLPVHPNGGPWIKAYEDLPSAALKEGPRPFCYDHVCPSESAADCRRQTTGRICDIKRDQPRLDNETDTDYYQRMDKLHWG